MEDVVKNLIEEALRKSLHELAEKQGEEKIGYIRGAVKRDTRAKGRFLDIDTIVSSVVSTAGKRGEGNKLPFQQALEVIKRGAAGYNERLSSTASLVNYLQSLYTPARQEGSCRDLGSLFGKALTNAAYQTILEDYDANVAGFANEKFVAGLLDMEHIRPGYTIKNALSDETEKVVKYSSIADMQLGGVGISLKTKTKGLGGSIANMAASLGIPLARELESTPEGGKVYHKFKGATPYDVLYLLIFQKGSARAESVISAARVDRSKVEKLLLNLGAEIHTEGGENFLVINQDIVDNAKTAPLSIVNKDLRYGSLGSVKQAEDLETRPISYKDGEENRLALASELGTTLTATLNELDNYFSNIHGLIMGYAADPTVNSLKKIKEGLREIATFTPYALSDKDC